MTAQNWHPYGRTLADDLALLANGQETGWWDEHGRPAPWPEDFLDPDAGWTTADPNADTTTDPDIDPDNPF